ncbi:hypothetical protein QMK19_39575, partial [Streptomyces sp. H10-C2]
AISSAERWNGPEFCETELGRNARSEFLSLSNCSAAEIRIRSQTEWESAERLTAFRIQLLAVEIRELSISSFCNSEGIAPHSFFRGELRLVVASRGSNRE